MTPKQRIISEIDSHGPIPFERFMEIALYGQNGFFTGGVVRSEKAGDFLTSPEVSPLFGRTLAEFVRLEHERIGDPFTLVEAAAGSGSLLRPLLEVYDVPALAVETSPAARSRLAGVADVGDSMPHSVRGVVIANELLDNLPMALAQNVDGEWRERWVGVEDDQLVFVDTPARTEVSDWLNANAGPVIEGGWVEVQLAAEEWVSAVWDSIEEGALLVFDYGDIAVNLLSRRQDGTLRTYRAHHLGPHPLDEPGQTDITADVNFTPLLASTGGELIRQDDFLADLGLRDRLSEIRHQELEAARSGDESRRLELRALKTEAETLLHPRGLGDFRVLVVRK